MNIFLGVAILILSTYIGSISSKKYTERKLFYIDFLSFNNKVKNEVSFSQKTILSILKNTTNNKSDFYDCAKGLFIDNNVFSFEKNYINAEEKDYLYNYLSSIGSSDKVTQIRYIDSVTCNIESKLKEAELNEKKYKKTYIKLGFLIGLIALIVLL